MLVKNRWHNEIQLADAMKSSPSYPEVELSLKFVQSAPALLLDEPVIQPLTESESSKELEHPTEDKKTKSKGKGKKSNSKKGRVRSRTIMSVANFKRYDL